MTQVETVLVKLPNFSLPDDKFIKGFSSRVPDIVDLTTYGALTSQLCTTEMRMLDSNMSSLGFFIYMILLFLQ